MLLCGLEKNDIYETFEFDREEDMGWKSIAEQTRHHPPHFAVVSFFRLFLL